MPVATPAPDTTPSDPGDRAPAHELACGFFEHRVFVDLPGDGKGDKSCNGISNYWEIKQGDIADCDDNGKHDPCDIAAGNPPDCDNDLVGDDCAIADGVVDDCNENGVPDSCDLADELDEDDNANDILDGCELARGDLNLDGCIDGADLAILLGL